MYTEKKRERECEGWRKKKRENKRKWNERNWIDE